MQESQFPNLDAVYTRVLGEHTWESHFLCNLAHHAALSDFSLARRHEERRKIQNRTAKVVCLSDPSRGDRWLHPWIEACIAHYILHRL